MMRTAPLLAEVRDLVRSLRSTDEKAGSLRKWSAKLAKEAGHAIPFRTIKRQEEETSDVSLAYVLACAIAADVEIVLGKNPRIVSGEVGDRAAELISSLRRAAAESPTIDPSEVEDIRHRIRDLLRAS
jgi:hypothetical protein